MSAELAASVCCNAPVRAIALTTYSTEYVCSKCGKAVQKITNLRSVFLRSIRKYRAIGYRDFADNNPPGTSLPIVYHNASPHSFLACPLHSDAHYSRDAVSLINLITLAYFDAYTYHTKKEHT